MTAPVVAQTAAEGPDLMAGVRGYLYVEPFEIRRELTVPLARVEDPGAAPAALDRAAQEAWIAAWTDRITDAARVRIDGEPFVADVREIRFIAIDPTLGPVPDERERIPFDEALVGAVFVQARDGFPRRADIEWTLFPRDAGAVPVLVEVMSGEEIHTESLVFTPAAAVQGVDLPEVAPAPRLLAVPAVPRGLRIGPYVIAGLLGVAAVGLAAFGVTGRARDRTSVYVSAALAALLAGGVSYDALARPGAGRITEAQAQGIIEGLLTNVYHAFAFRDESVIFDTLAESVDGPLLEELYLDIRRGLELEEGGGPRVRVLRVSLADCSVLQAAGGVVRARVVWISAGDVSHWGHTHRRRNQYRSDLRIEGVDGRWKITDVDILAEERT